MKQMSRMPAEASASNPQSVMRLPGTWASHLGVSVVAGISRRPRPAPMIMARTAGLFTPVDGLSNSFQPGKVSCFDVALGCGARILSHMRQNSGTAITRDTNHERRSCVPNVQLRFAGELLRRWG